jgi:hypothetical protein
MNNMNPICNMWLKEEDILRIVFGKPVYRCGKCYETYNNDNK